MGQLVYSGSWNSSVGTTASYRMYIPAGARDFPFPVGSRLVLGPIQPPIKQVPERRAVSLGVKWQEHEAGHSPPFSTVYFLSFVIN